MISKEANNYLKKNGYSFEEIEGIKLGLEQSCNGETISNSEMEKFVKTELFFDYMATKKVKKYYTQGELDKMIKKCILKNAEEIVFKIKKKSKMKTTKIIIFILILLTGTNVYSSDFYTVQNFDTVKNKLIETSKGKSYYDRFDIIINKYAQNKEVLIKLQKRILELKAVVEKDGDKYSEDIVKLISYMDLSVYLLLDKLGIIPVDDSIIEEEVEDIVIVDEPKEEAIINYPGFSDEYDDNIKNIVAGEDFIVFSGKTSSKYEAVDVGSIKFYINGLNATDIKNTLDSAYLYLEGVYIGKAASSSIDVMSSTQATITFENLDNFVVPQKEVSFRLGIKANSIGYEKIGKTLKDLKITKVSLYDAVGLNSGNNISAFTTTIDAEPFSIVPGKPFVSVINDLYNSTVIKFNVKGEFGDNTIDLNNTVPSIQLNKIKFNVHDNSDTATFKLVNTNNSTDEVIGVKNGAVIEFDLSAMSDGNKTIENGSGENYEIYISNTSMGVNIEMPKDAITYDVLGVSGANNLNINMKNIINFGYRDF